MTQKAKGNNSLEAGDGSGTLSADGQEGGDGATADGGYRQSFNVAEAVAPVDIFIGIDTSGSMTTERTYLEQNMASFLATLEKNKVDAHVTAIGSGFKFPAGLPADKFAIVPREIASRDAIFVMTNFFQLGTQPLAPRPSARLEVIIITDDDGGNTGNLAENFQGPAGRKPAVSGIVGKQVGVSATNPECNIVRVGQQYMKLAATTGGDIYDLCEKDWTKLFQHLSKQIINRTRSFVLEKIPNRVRDITVYVGTVPVPATQFTYIEDQNSILIAPEFEIKSGAKVSIKYFPM